MFTRWICIFLLLMSIAALSACQPAQRPTDNDRTVPDRHGIINSAGMDSEVGQWGEHDRIFMDATGRDATFDGNDAGENYAPYEPEKLKWYRNWD